MLMNSVFSTLLHFEKFCVLQRVGGELISSVNIKTTRKLCCCTVQSRFVKIAQPFDMWCVFVSVGGMPCCLLVLLTSCFRNREAAVLSLCSCAVVIRRRALMSRLSGPGSTARPAPQTTAAETAAPRNLHDPGLGEWSCRWQRTIWSIIDCLLLLFLLWRDRAWWGSQGQSQWPLPSLPDLLSLDRLPVLESEHPSSRQTPPRSSRRGSCYRTWCWGTRGLRVWNHSWVQLQLQLQLQPLHHLPPPPLYRSDSSPDRGVQGKWPRWGGHCPLQDLCPWSQNGLQTSTWSPLRGSTGDLPFLPRGKVIVSLFCLLFAHRFLTMSYSTCKWRRWWKRSRNSMLVTLWLNICKRLFMNYLTSKISTVARDYNHQIKL